MNVIMILQVMELILVHNVLHGIELVLHQVQLPY